jgi:hypothetical protein
MWHAFSNLYAIDAHGNALDSPLPQHHATDASKTKVQPQQQPLEEKTSEEATPEPRLPDPISDTKKQHVTITLELADPRTVMDTVMLRVGDASAHELRNLILEGYAPEETHIVLVRRKC